VLRYGKKQRLSHLASEVSKANLLGKEDEMAEERRKRRGFLALAAVVLAIVALLSFISPSAWATPAQEYSQQQSVPPVKEADMEVVCPGEDFVFTITFRAGPEDWYNVVVTDNMDPLLTIDSVWASQGTAGFVGQVVTVDVGYVPKGTTVTIKITCTLSDTAPAGFRIDNTASVVVQDPSLEFDPSSYIEVCHEFVPEPSSLLLLGSGLAGLAGYAGIRWSRNRA
jgi:hypothetical protein